MKILPRVIAVQALRFGLLCSVVCYAVLRCSIKNKNYLPGCVIVTDDIQFQYLIFLDIQYVNR